MRSGAIRFLDLDCLTIPGDMGTGAGLASFAGGLIGDGRDASAGRGATGSGSTGRGAEDGGSAVLVTIRWIDGAGAASAVGGGKIPCATGRNERTAATLSASNDSDSRPTARRRNPGESAFGCGARLEPQCVHSS